MPSLTKGCKSVEMTHAFTHQRVQSVNQVHMHAFLKTDSNTRTVTLYNQSHATPLRMSEEQNHAIMSLHNPREAREVCI
jgi:hypothetical protein